MIINKKQKKNKRINKELSCACFDLLLKQVMFIFFFFELKIKKKIEKSTIIF